MSIYNQLNISSSSSPLSTLMPQYNPYKLPDYTQAFSQGMQSISDSMRLQQSLLDMQSSDPLTAIQGKQDQLATITDGVSKIGSGLWSLQEKGVSPKTVGIPTKTGNIMGMVGAAADMVGSFMPDKSEYSGTKGSITQTMDSVYDSISNAAMSFGPIGQLVGGIMKGGALLGKGMNALGGGTSGMTGIDAVLGSSFLNLTPLGLINGFGGRHADTITKNNLAFEKVGASYTGSNKTIDDALVKSNAKYGLFSGGALNDANAEMREARLQQWNIANIADNATDAFNIQNSMSAINSNRRKYHMQGGYNQASVFSARKGAVLQKSREILSNTKRDPFEYYLSTLPKNQQDTINYRVKDYWEFNGKPKDFDEAISRGMFHKLPDGWHARSVAENPTTGEIEYMKSENHPTRYMESDWYEKGLIYNDDGTTTQLAPGIEGYEDWQDFKNNYELIKSSPYWKYVKKNPKEFKEGGNILKEIILPQILREIQLEPKEFKEGGKFNIIPEGALHARKHNMDVQGITKKGIPVVSESTEGEIKQQAEIERQELILRLEVTKKLEELLKEYNTSTKKRKDELAIDAGKLLTQELIHNTKNNTNEQE